jgi:glycosyltransferase involved in cell wall biosynthesis
MKSGKPSASATVSDTPVSHPRGRSVPTLQPDLRKLLNTAAASLPPGVRELVPEPWKERLRPMLRSESFQRFEILVLDDASPTLGTAEVAERFAAADPRIRLIRMKKNGGAYIARNRGLDEATGKYVTLHDADDWAHPVRIETQVRFMESAPRVKGCLTEQTRATAELHFTRWSGSGELTIPNMSSFLFRRAEMRAHFGYWDGVRFAADSELIRRFTSLFGERAVVRIRSGPLAFPRTPRDPVDAEDALASTGYRFGPRRLYLDALRAHHASGARLRYGSDPEDRPFPVPEIMRQTKAERETVRHYDVITASDFRKVCDNTRAVAEELRCQHRGGLKSAVFQMAAYDCDHEDRPITPEIWNQIDNKSISILSCGEAVSCDLLILRSPAVLQEHQRYLPKVAAKQIKVIVDRAPLDSGGGESGFRYRIADCAANIRRQFGRQAVWHPIGPPVRAVLAALPASDWEADELSPEDWHEIGGIDHEAHLRRIGAVR